MRRGELLEALDSGALTNRLAQVYGADARSGQRYNISVM